jgi:hypothetical protein
MAIDKARSPGWKLCWNDTLALRNLLRAFSTGDPVKTLADNRQPAHSIRLPLKKTLIYLGATSPSYTSNNRRPRLRRADPPTGESPM